MISFTPVPTGTLNQDGSVEGIKVKQPEPNIGIPTSDFHQQVIELAQQKVPIEKINQAIDAHPDIHDKETAKSMADAVLQIVGKGK